MPLPAQNAASSAGERPVSGGFFISGLSIAIGSALAIAAGVAPLAAMGVAVAGFRYPFPRIFDRTVMVALGSVLLLFAGRLELLEFLRLGFRDMRANLPRLAGGFAAALAAVGVLFTLAGIAGGSLCGPGVFVYSVLHYLPAAIAIAVLEESFFRAFVLAGMERDFGSGKALAASSGFFAIVHVVRSPARFFLTGFHPAAGAETLLKSGARLAHPAEALPFLLGLFLLGLVLGQAFILTRRVYCSIGLHAGFVLGAKTWGHAISGDAPRWLAGTGPVPLIAGPAAWLLTAILLMALPLGLGPSHRRSGFQQS